jgi:Acyltransferase family
MTTAPLATTRILSPELSTRLRFWSLMAMVLLVYVHAFNLHPRYLAAMTLVEEAATWDHVLQYLIANGLVRFRIPILFAISGYIFAFRDDGTTTHRTRLAKRFRTLGIPYIAWSAIALGLTASLEMWAPTRELVRAAGLSSFGPELPFVSDYSIKQLIDRWLFDPSAFQLWFLRTLLILSAIYPWLKTAVTRWPRAFFAFAVLAWYLIGAEGLLFFSLGIWLAITNVDVLAKPKWLHVPVLLALWLALCGIKTWMAFSIENMSEPIAFGMMALHRGGEAAGMLAAWFGMDGIARAAMRQSLFRWLAGFSFIIYALHVPMVNYVTEYALKIGTGIAHIELWTYLLVPLVVVAITVVIGAVFRATARPVYSLLTGGRGL